MSVIDDLPDEQDDSSNWCDIRDQVIATIDTAIKALTDGDVGAHWESKVIEASKVLMANDKALFQRKRAELKRASKAAQITEWMKEVNQTDTDQDDTKSGELVNIVTDVCELFHDKKENSYVSFDHDGHRETWMIGSKGFVDWLGFKAYRELGFSPSENIIKQTITSLNGIAKYDGDEREVYLRCAPCKDGYIIDLCDDKWQAIKITKDNWQLIVEPEVRFIRSINTASLPIPESANLDLLWKHVNIPVAYRPLILAFIIESWRPDTPFTVLMLWGEQGSAKSSTHKRIRQLSDPNNIPLRSAPKTVEDIYVSAGNNWQASFENMSNLSSSMQDALCTLATGGGYATRKLYSNDEESVIDVKRPVILNGISSVTTRPDLIDRTISIALPKLKDSKRKRDAELDQEFKKDAPAILAGLLDLFKSVLNELPNVHIDTPPRMIDFAYLGEAVCVAQGDEAGLFNELYQENRRNSLMHALDGSPIALAVMEMMHLRGYHWSGTFKQLKTILDKEYKQDGEGWAKSPKGLSEALRRMTPALREMGLGVDFEGHSRDGNMVRIYLLKDILEPKNNVHTVTQHTGKDSGCEHVNVELENKKSATEKTFKEEF